jgi:hypothetical protein
MKTKSLLCVLHFVVLFFIVSAAQAQLTDVLNKAKTTANAKAAGPGQLLTQIAGAIKPTSFLSSFAGSKSAWLSKAGKVTDAIGMAQSISSLAGFVKPDMFKSGFNVSSLLQTAGTVKTLTSAAGLLKNFEGGLKPDALSSSWGQQRSGWLSALSLLK